MRWRGRAVVVAVALAAVASTVAVAIAAGARPAGSEAAQVLRLGDLPLGYLNLELREEHGDAPTCERLTEPEDTPPRMLRFVRRYHPRGCIAGYSLLFSEPGESPSPLLVGTGILDAHSTAEAGAAWRVVPELLGRLNGDRLPTATPPPARIGSATRLFHTRMRLFTTKPQTTSILVWRSGTTLAAAMAIGRSFAVDDVAAAGFARRQQAHIAAPTPYTEAELFDGEVPLENPAIDLPVHWLGRNFRPGGGLPENHLFDSYFPGKALPESNHGFAEGPVPPLGIRYENIGIDAYRREDWPVYAHSKTGRAITSWKCTKTRMLAVPGGTATIYGGYSRDFARCPMRPPRAFTAWVKYGDTTVVVDAPFAADSIEIVNPYGSFAGMEAIVSSLRLRPPGGD